MHSTTCIGAVSKTSPILVQASRRPDRKSVAATPPSTPASALSFRSTVSSFLGLDNLHLFNGNAQGLSHVAEIGDVAESRLTFRRGERLFHSLLVLEVELVKPVVRRLVSFGVHQRVVLDVLFEPLHLLRDRRVGVLPVAAELFPAHARLLEQHVDDLHHLWDLLPDPPPSGRLTFVSKAGCHPAQPGASAEGLELARIGSLLFIFADSPNDQNGSSSSIDTFATRLSAQPLIHRSA